MPGSTIWPEVAEQQRASAYEQAIEESLSTTTGFLLRLPYAPEVNRTGSILKGKRQVERLFPAWHELLRTTSTAEFYHQPEWCGALLATLEDDQVLVYVEHRDGELSAVVPLLTGSYSLAGIPLRSISLLHNLHSPFSDYIVGIDSEAVGLLKRLIGSLKQERIGWDLFYCPNVTPHSHVVRDMQASPEGLRIVQQKRMSDYFRAEPYDVTLQRFSSNFRGNLRKSRNRLKELPDVRFEWNREESDVRGAFREFLQVEASGWKWIKQTSLLQSPKMLEFYENLIDQFGPQGQCGIHLLKQENNLLAGQFAIYQGSVCSVFKIGYDETHARLSPGNMLLEALLKRHQGNDEIREINLISGMDWHKNWKPSSMPISNYFQFNFNSRALLAYSLYQGKKWTESLSKDVETNGS